MKHHPPALKLPVHDSNPRPELLPLVEDFHSKGIVELVEDQPCYLSRIFSVPKASGGSRLVIDLSLLNTLIECPTFKMAQPSVLRTMLPRSAWFTKLDIQDAFPHVPVHPRFRKFLTFSHDRKLYQFTALPFGLNISPKIFTRISKPALTKIHLAGVTASVYLDDWLIWAQSRDQCTLFTSTAVEILQNLGFLINHKKSETIPTRSI